MHNGPSLPQSKRTKHRLDKLITRMDVELKSLPTTTMMNTDESSKAFAFEGDSTQANAAFTYARKYTNLMPAPAIAEKVSLFPPHNFGAAVSNVKKAVLRPAPLLSLGRLGTQTELPFVVKEEREKSSKYLVNNARQNNRRKSPRINLDLRLEDDESVEGNSPRMGGGNNQNNFGRYRIGRNIAAVSQSMHV